MLAHTCWNELRDHGSKRPAVLDERVVEASMELLVRQYDPFYTQIWSDLTSIQQKTLVAVIQERGVSLQSLKVTQFVGKGASTVQRALGGVNGTQCSSRGRERRWSEDAL